MAVVQALCTTSTNALYWQYKRSVLAVQRLCTDDFNMQSVRANIICISDEDKKAFDVLFKNPESNFKIAIVVSMWITGFFTLQQI